MIQYIGLDVHKENISVCVFKENDKEPEIEKVLINTRKEIEKFFGNRKKEGSILCCYEAGCLGTTIYRQLTDMGVTCWIVAPNKIPRRAGDRVKTDKRDARMLAKLLRSDELKPINVLSKKDEAVRDLLRGREDFLGEQKRFKNMLGKFLIRAGFSYKKGLWTKTHKEWISSLKFEYEYQKDTCEEYLTHINELEEKIKRFDKMIGEIAAEPEYAKKIKTLCALKGINILTGLSLLCEIGDFNRFETADQFMSYLGLVPSEFSSGDKRRQGSITKTGNSHIRCLLVQAAWQYRNKSMNSKRMLKKRQDVSETMAKYAIRAGMHLNQKYRRLVARGKPSTKAVTAVARELSGFIWGTMTGNIN